MLVSFLLSYFLYPITSVTAFTAFATKLIVFSLNTSPSFEIENVCQSDLIFLARFGAAHEGGPFDMDIVGGDGVVAYYDVLCFIEQRRIGFRIDDDVVFFS